MPLEFQVCNLVLRRRLFGKLLNHLGLLGNAVEVGTHRGEFAAELLQRWGGQRLFCVDPWSNPPGYDDPAGRGDRHEDERMARENLKPYGGRVQFVVDTSLNAAKRFENGAFDFIYIDADHRRECVLADCLAWWPKVRRGGILAGHDLTGVWGDQVRPAVEEFAERWGLYDAWLVRGDGVDKFPPHGDAASWYFRKDPYS